MTSDRSLVVEALAVTGLELGAAHGYGDGIVTLDPARLRSVALGVDGIAGLDIGLAVPGQDVRIVNCLDVVEPRFKIEGPGSIFPGFLGPPLTGGRGRTGRLSGMALVSTLEFPQPQSGLLTARDAIVEMAGPAADYSPFSRYLNVVLQFTAEPSLTNEDADAAVRFATLRIAEDLARACFDSAAAPDSIEVDLTPTNRGLPRVAYFYQVQSQGSMADTFVYGKPAGEMLPTLIRPQEIIDGALVSGVYVYAAVRNPTFFHQNNPVMWELLHRHGTDLDFAGIILNRGHNYTQAEKERSSYYAANLAELVGADGVILTTEGGGNSIIDTMLACQYIEQAGIRTTLVNYEQTGPDGRGDALFYSVPEADAIVSLGSFGTEIHLPSVGTVLGGSTLRDGETTAGGELDVSGLAMLCSTSQVGGNLLIGKEF